MRKSGSSALGKNKKPVVKTETAVNANNSNNTPEVSGVGDVLRLLVVNRLQSGLTRPGSRRLKAWTARRVERAGTSPKRWRRSSNRRSTTSQRRAWHWQVSRTALK